MQNCIICGAGYGLHQYGTLFCPKNGMEEIRPGIKQQWDGTTFTQMSKTEIMLITQREKITQSLQSLSPDFTDPDNLENKTLPELIELLIAAGNYWKEQAEN